MVQSSEEISRSVLQPADLAVDPSLKIVKIVVAGGADWTGDPAIRVVVVLDKDTNDESMRGKGPRLVIDKIEERLTGAGVALRPIVSFCLEGEEALSDFDDDEGDELRP